MSDEPRQRAGFVMRSLAGERFPPPARYLETIQDALTFPIRRIG